MSFATTIGHTFTGVVGHHGLAHVPRHPTAAPATTQTPAARRPRRGAPATAVGAADTDNRDELDQWRAAFTLASPFNR